MLDTLVEANQIKGLFKTSHMVHSTSLKIIWPLCNGWVWFSRVFASYCCSPFSPNVVCCQV